MPIENREAVRRRRVVHGWAFRSHTDVEVAAIKQFISDGTMGVEFPDEYRKLNAAVK